MRSHNGINFAGRAYELTMVSVVGLAITVIFLFVMPVEYCVW